MSSSVAVRAFLTQLPSIEAREPYLPTLLPPLCLNRSVSEWGEREERERPLCECLREGGREGERALCECMCMLYRYYVAEGVKLYCQETWRLVTEMRGVQLVEKYITQVTAG